MLVGLATLLHGSEVDNYYAWGEEIKDSSSAFNRYLNTQVRQSLEKLNKEDILECKSVALKVMRDIGAVRYPLGYRGALNTDMELWALNSDKIDKVPRHGSSMEVYAKGSIFAPTMRTMLVPTELAVTLNVNGVYFGTDKISHFLGSGYEYYRKYLKNRKKHSEVMAEALALKWGVEMEDDVLGTKVVGIFSYADLEANYQGLKMAKSFCRPKNPAIEQLQGQWVLVRAIDMRDYINPNWDESFNVSAYTRHMLKKVKKNLIHIGLCKKLEQPWVKEHLAAYRSRDKNWFETRSFFDTGLSSQVLYLAQHYEPGSLSKESYRSEADMLGLALTYEEFLMLHREMKLQKQSLYTLEHLCSEIETKHKTD